MDDWEIVSSNRNKKVKVCESHLLNGTCTCVNKINKAHPKVCFVFMKKFECLNSECEYLHPKNVKKKKKSRFCEDYTNYGFCECLNKNNYQHPKLCQNFINNMCEKKKCDLFHISSKKKRNIILCQEYLYNGICKNKQCSKMHPKLCPIIKCEEDEEICKYFHPFKYPNVCDSVNENRKCQYTKCLFYHPDVCYKKNCCCKKYHLREVIKLEHIKNWSKDKSSTQNSIEYYEKYIKIYVDEQNEFIISNLRKHLAKNLRFDLLEYLIAQKDRYVLNARHFSENIHVFSEILWPNNVNEDTYFEDSIKTIHLFLDKKFQLLDWNKWNESIFGVLNNPENNNMTEELKYKLCLYFLYDWNDKMLINNYFKNMWNKVSNITVNKMWKYLQFLLFKNSEEIIKYLCKNIFESHGTQISNNIIFIIELTINLLVSIPEDNNDMYYIYNYIDINWNERKSRNIELFLECILMEYNKNRSVLYQNSLRLGTALGFLYKKNMLQKEILNFLNDFENRNIVAIFIEFYDYSNISKENKIVKRFIKEIYEKIENKKDKFEIQRKLSLL